MRKIQIEIYTESKKEKIYLEDIISDICLRLERHFELYVLSNDGTKKFLVDDHFTSPPAKEEQYCFNGNIYEVISVMHYSNGKQPSSIMLKEL